MRTVVVHFSKAYLKIASVYTNVLTYFEFKLR